MSRQKQWGLHIVCMQGPAALTAGLSIDSCCCPSCLLPPLCRNALKRGTSPELTAALQGVTGVRFFLGGLGVQKGLTMQEMYDLAAAAGVSVLLLSALPMEIVGAVAPALRVAPETEQ